MSHIEEAVDYIFNEYCLDSTGTQIRRMSGIGISMGAGVLAIYAAKVGAQCKFDSCVSIGCHYNFEQALVELKSNTFGAYDVIIAKGFHVYGVEYYRQFDELAAKKCPERVVGDLPAKVALASEISRV